MEAVRSQSCKTSRQEKSKNENGCPYLQLENKHSEVTSEQMNEQFWHDRWETNQIAFHNHDTNPLLARHLQTFLSRPNPRVLVPLCGKSRDMVWLAQQGCRVTGVELSELAVEQFFREWSMEPNIKTAGSLKRYEADGLVIFQGSIFDLTPELLAPIDFVYDRAALVALPEDLRERYANLLIDLTARAPQLLICYEYDQTCSEGPPFSVSEEEIRHLYGGVFHSKLLGRYEVENGLKGKCTAFEAVWHLESL